MRVTTCKVCGALHKKRQTLTTIQGPRTMHIYADPKYTAIIYVHSEENKLIAQIPFMAEWSNEEEFDEALNQAVKSLCAAYQFWPGEYIHIRVVRQHTYLNVV